MAAVQRRVGRLRVSAPDAASARRVAIKLEDALHTASLPDSGGRLLFLRRLDLGALNATLAPATIALRIEQAMACAYRIRVHGAQPEAVRADAVWFRDALELHVTCARRVLHGLPCRHWFWQRGLPAVRLDDGMPRALRDLAQSLIRLPERAAAIPAWIAMIEQAGGFGGLCAALSPNDARALVAACSERPTGRSGTEADSKRAYECASPALARYGATVSAAAPVRARAAVQADVDADEVAAVLRVLRRRDRAQMPDGASTANTTEPRRAGSIEPGRDVALAARSATAGRTAAGGLLFLLNVLGRLGCAQWLDAQAASKDPEMPRRVLARVLHRLRVASDDPAWTVVEPCSHEGVLLPPFIAPVAWREGLGFNPQLRETSARPFGQRVAQLWSIALRRWLRRYARIGLAELVLRPGRIDHSATHVDLAFDPQQSDMRIRRAGLDLDPGWVPWFGRVVTFRYELSESR